MNTIISKEIYFDPRLSRIGKLQMEITKALINNHKATVDDEFKFHREEIDRLRKELQIGKI